MNADIYGVTRSLRVFLYESQSHVIVSYIRQDIMTDVYVLLFGVTEN